MQPIKEIFRALRSKNYRLFFFGQFVSLTGTWMTRIATIWLVYRLTHSAFFLGLVGFASQIPSFILTPVAGVIVDRLNLHRLVIVTQCLAMLQSALLAALALSGVISIGQILALNIFQGLIDSFDMPTRQSFMIHLIEDKQDLSNAIALNSSLVNGTRLIGPSLAGILIAASSEGICFLIDSLSYIAVIAALLAMDVTLPSRKRAHEHLFHGLKEGFRYVSGFVPIRAILLLLALVSLMGMPYAILMPIFADKILGGGPYRLGFLMGASGCGALLGALYLASRKSVIGLGRIIPQAAITFGIALIAFSFSRSFRLSLVIISLAGFGMMVEMAASNTLLQTIVDDDKRGRTMSFFAMSFTGMAPFGSLLAGTLAARIGAPGTLFFGGIVCILGAVLFMRRLPLLREKIRPIYLRKGILREAISGVDIATQLESTE
ncbi:MAG TPA: MFS transporter [Candidatus Omnitrophota bacterium]|nr:MFS transporter [Candidatus Omnitrophota bacterium]